MGLNIYLIFNFLKATPASLMVSVTACHQFVPGSSPDPGTDFLSLFFTGNVFLNMNFAARWNYYILVIFL